MEGRPLDESELIDHAREGDVDAYAALVRRHQDLAFRAAYLIVRDPDEAKDAVQEALVKAYRALGRFRPAAPFRPWLLRIVSNEARNRRRSLGRRAGLALRVAEDRPDGGTAPSPEAAVLVHEQRATLLAALERLRPQDRDIVTGRFLLELSEAEVAAALGIPIGTAKSRLSRALGRLRLDLAAREDPR